MFSNHEDIHENFPILHEFIFIVYDTFVSIILWKTYFNASDAVRNHLHIQLWVKTRVKRYFTLTQTEAGGKTAKHKAGKIDGRIQMAFWAHPESERNTK